MKKKTLVPMAAAAVVVLLFGAAADAQMATCVQTCTLTFTDCKQRHKSAAQDCLTHAAEDHASCRQAYATALLTCQREYADCTDDC